MQISYPSIFHFLYSLFVFLLRRSTCVWSNYVWYFSQFVFFFNYHQLYINFARGGLRFLSFFTNSTSKVFKNWMLCWNTIRCFHVFEMDRGWNNDAVNMPSSYVESSVYLLKRSESTLQPLCYVNRNMVVISYIYIYRSENRTLRN